MFKLIHLGLFSNGLPSRQNLTHKSKEFPDKSNELSDSSLPSSRYKDRVYQDMFPALFSYYCGNVWSSLKLILDGVNFLLLFCRMSHLEKLQTVSWATAHLIFLCTLTSRILWKQNGGENIYFRLLTSLSCQVCCGFPKRDFSNICLLDMEVIAAKNWGWMRENTHTQPSCTGIA